MLQMSCDSAAGGGASFSSLCQDRRWWLMAELLRACRLWGHEPASDFFGSGIFALFKCL